MADRRLRAARSRDGADAGDKARHRNLWSAAAGYYERYLAKHPNDLGVRVRLANTLREAGDYPSAIAVLQEAMTARPEKASIQLTLADILDEAGFTIDAEAIRKQATGAEPVSSNPSELGVITRPLAPASPARRIEIRIDARTGEERGLNATLASLRGLTSTDWRATISGGAGLLEDVASTDPRVVSPPESAPDTFGGPVFLIKAGTVLTPDCLSWLLWALTDEVSAVYCDHEEEDVNAVMRPILQSSPHLLDILSNPTPPSLVLYSCLEGNIHERDVFSQLRRAFSRGTVRHVPLVLGCVQTPGRETNIGSSSALQREVGGRILVVIPTREEGAALDVMLASLFRQASNGAKLDVVVIDNGSQEISTLDVLEHWRNKGVEVLRCDEPFNWSSLNNTACEGRENPIVVFANNDMEMLSENWDLEVRRLLAIEGVGVVGARLLYPNDRVQHAGIVMGALNGEPLHEGLRAGPDERGPLDRWVRRRPATAVTGAFMAMRRSVFDQVGGFDAENFAVSCNDVDFCLRAGEVGWTILYAPELVLRHHESLSRGHSNTEAKRQRAAEEMGRLLARWGDRARFDPTRNPQWEGRGIRLFAGMRNLTAEEVMDWAIKTESRAPNQTETPTLA
jgi:GT2 family glycosyltransferase